VLPGERFNKAVVTYLRAGKATGMTLPDAPDLELKTFRSLAPASILARPFSSISARPVASRTGIDPSPGGTTRDGGHQTTPVRVPGNRGHRLS
jgi:hypothetical protein